MMETLTFDQIPREAAPCSTPTASAASDSALPKLTLKSPLARGDEASTLGGAVDHCSADEEVVSTKLAPTTATPLKPAPPPTRAQPPAWLTGLVSSQLFNPCPYHATAHKNECNHFCFSCTPATGIALCRHCLPHHTCSSSTSSFQIRRYMYQTVVHHEDLSIHYDLTGIQTYCINQRRAVLIRPKPPPATAKNSPAFEHSCRGCRVPLRPDCDYCSLKCKVDSDYGVEPSTPGPAAGGVRGPMTTTGLLDGSLRVATAEYSEGRFGRYSSEAYTTGTVHTGCKRRKLDRPQRSHVF